jgi:hypothetical protein
METLHASTAKTLVQFLHELDSVDENVADDFEYVSGDVSEHPGGHADIDGILNRQNIGIRNHSDLSSSSLGAQLADEWKTSKVYGLRDP